MPETEPKPKLVELVPGGAGQGWKAVLKNGKQVVIHEIALPAAEAAAAVPRIQRLAEHRHPALSPVLAWGTEPNGIWVAVEFNEGVPLSTILTRGPLTAPAAAALGAALLSGIAALHEAGISMGGFGANSVRVTNNGDVRLSGHPASVVRGAPSQSDLRADVRSCGMAICAAFGVDPAGAPAPPTIPPGLVVTMRSMASGAMGPAADRAQGALREMAAALLAPDRMTSAQTELALRAGGREMPRITPFIPQPEAPPPPPAPAPPPAAPEPPPPPPAAPAAVWTPPPAPPAPPPAPPPPFVREPTPLPAAAPYEAPARSLETYPGLPITPVPAEVPPPPAAWTPAALPPPAPVPPPAPPVAPIPPSPAPSAPVYFEAVPPPKTLWESPEPAPEPVEAALPTWTAIPAPRTDTEPLPDYLPAQDSEPAPVEHASRPPIETATPVPIRRTPAPRRRADEPSEGRPAWIVPAAIAVVILILLGVGGIYLASRGSGSHSVAGNSPGTSPATSSKPSSKPATSPTPTHGPQTVPTYAPSTAGAVTSVALDSSTNCQLTGPCNVEVEVHFSSAQNTDIAFIVKFFDRCSGVTTDLPGNHFTPPGYTTVQISRNDVPLPVGAKSAAIVAVTTTPASAASAPLLLGASTC